LIASQIAERSALVVPGISLVGIDCERVFTRLQRLLIASQVAKRKALVVPGGGVVGSKGKRMFPRLQRLLIPPKPTQCIGAVKRDPKGSGCKLGGALEEGQRLDVLALCQQRLATSEQVVGAFGGLGGSGCGSCAALGDGEQAQQLGGGFGGRVGFEITSLDALH